MGGTGDGSGWASPTNSIQGAIDAASGGETILVSNGTYNITADIAVSKAVTICSFGNGVTGGLANAASTILSRGGGRWNFYITAAATVDGFTGTGASAANQVGANFYVSAGATVKNCILRNNATGYPGSHPAGYMVSGVVSNCLIYGNTTGDRQHAAGAFRIDSGTMVACRIYYNTLTTQADGGGGVWLNGSGATQRNCVVYGNMTSGNGGGVYLSNGTVENCTIYGNTATGSGGGIYRTGGIVRNCIVYNNTAGDANKNIAGADANVTYTCTTNPVSTGVNCVTADPLFRDVAEGNFGLSTGSPCIDKGTNQTWMTAGITDLVGNERKQDGDNDGTATVDMGAYEFNSAFNGDFVGSPRALIVSPFTYQCFGPAPFIVLFTGSAYGTNLSGVVYQWDFDGDGTWDTDWSSANTTSCTYSTVGVYSPKLQVSNTVVEVNVAVKTSYVSVGKTVYVTTSGTGNFLSWAMAGGTITGAVALTGTYNGDQILVSNGTYSITAQIVPKANTSIRSFGNGLAGGLANAAATIVRRSSGSIRLFRINAVNTTVDGFTIQEGSVGAVEPNNLGCGVAMTASGAILKNCIVTANNPGWNQYAGGVYITDGVVSNCLIRANTCGDSRGGTGTGVYIAGANALVVGCQILENGGAAANGAGVYMSSGTLRNCLIARNTLTSANNGAGVYMTDGTVENCTIVTNSTVSSGGGIYRTGGTVRNCIVYNNTSGAADTYKNIYGADANVTYTCTTNPVSTGAGCISGDPKFSNPAANDYTLQAASPCIDGGANQAWMTGAKDLAGLARILKGTIGLFVDMGAYETYVPPKGTVLIVF